MSSSKCLPNGTKMSISIFSLAIPAVFLMLLVVPFSNAAPERVPQVLHRQIRSPVANTAHRLSTEAKKDPNANYLKSDPLDLHVSIGEVASFDIFLS